MGTPFATLDEALRQFDFDRVHQVMRLLDWKWTHGDHRTATVPTVEELRETAVQLHERVFFDDTTLASETGGFSLERLDENDEYYTLGERFTLSFDIGRRKS